MNVTQELLQRRINFNEELNLVILYNLTNVKTDNIFISLAFIYNNDVIATTGLNYLNFRIKLWNYISSQ